MSIYLFTVLMISAVVGILWISVLLIIDLTKRPINQSFDNIEQSIDYPHPVLIVKKGGIVTYYNPGFMELFGFTSMQRVDIDALALKSKDRYFYKIFNQPGKYNLIIEDEEYDVFSYETSDGMLVTFQKQLINYEDENNAHSYFPFLAAILTNNDINQTVLTISKEIQKRAPFDFLEIMILDPERDELVFYNPERIKKSGNNFIPKRTSRISSFIDPIINKKEMVLLNKDQKKIGILNEIIPPNLNEIRGIPLIVDSEVIGIVVLGTEKELENPTLGSLNEDGFLNFISTGLYLNWTKAEIARKSIELGGLANLSVSFRNIHEPEELFRKIIFNFGHLLQVDIFGFILFDESSSTLEAKKPFVGIPDPIVDVIHIRIEQNSKAEQILFSQDILIADNSMEDQHWVDLGLSHFANAVTIRESVLIPLTPGSEPMGFILVANHQNGASSFSQDEMHLLMIIANQTAPLIENLYLLIQSKLRTQRAEVLRRISSLASSNATLDEIFGFSVNELSLLLHAEMGGIILVDNDRSTFRWKSDVKFGNWEIKNSIAELSLDSSDFLETVSNTKEPLLIGKFDETILIPNYYQNLMEMVQFNSAIFVPMIVKNQGIGEIWFGSTSLSFFDHGDIQIVMSAANQLAYLVEQANLSKLTLEAINEKIEQEKLIDELQKINSFGQKITSLLPELILKELLDIIFEFVPMAESGWVGLMESTQQIIKPLYFRNYDYEFSSMNFPFNRFIEQIFSNQNTAFFHDLEFPMDYELSEQEAIQYLNATHHRLPMSSLCMPISTSKRSIGLLVLEIYSEDKKFSPEDQSITQSIVHQVNLALENADLFRTSERQSQKLKILSDLSKSLSASLNRNELNNSILKKLNQLIEYQTATFWEKEKNYLKIIDTDGFIDNEDRQGILVHLEDSLLFQEMFSTKKSVVIANALEDDRFPVLMEVENLSWLGVPLISKSEIIGVIALEKKEKNFYQADLIQIVEAYAAQAANAIENANLYQDLINRSNELNERTQKLSWLNEFSSEVNRSLDISNIAELTSKYLKNLIKIDALSIFFIENANQIWLSYSNPTFGDLKNIDISSDSFFEKIKQSGGIYQIKNMNENSEVNKNLKDYFFERGSVSLLLIPLMSSSKVYGWICLEDKIERGYTYTETELATTLTNQASLAFENAFLFSETNNLKENLEKRVELRTNELKIEQRNTELLLTISNKLSESMDIDQILKSTLVEINNSMDVSGSILHLKEQDKFFQISDPDMNEFLATMKVQLNEFFTEVYSEKKSVYEENLSLQFPNVPYKSWMFLPLKFGEAILGILTIFHQESNHFSIRDQELAEAIAGQLSIALNNTEIFSLVRDQSENLGVMLREQEVEASRSKAILEAVADGVLVTGLNKEIILINNSAKRIMKIDSNRFDLSFENLSSIFGDRIDIWLSKIREWTEHPPSNQSETLIAEKLAIHKDQVISVHLSPVFWHNEFLGTVSVFRDITYAVQVDQLKTDFIANISHELRTPLTSIKGYVEILLMGASGDLDIQQKQFLEIIQSNTNRLTGLVDEILDISTIESGQINLQLKQMDFASKLVEIVEKHKKITTGDNKNIEYITNISDISPYIVADPLRIEQILMNILNNAREFSFNNSQIMISVEKVNEKFKIVIKDFGKGIPLEDQKHIFDRFYRGKYAVDLHTAGTGLGLSISKTLIEMHGGTIALYSSGVTGEGTEVCIEIPIRIEKE